MSNKLQFRIVCMGILILLFIKGELSAQTTQTFTSSGTFTVPAGVTSVQVEAWGGGGAGGGVNASFLATRAGGGGAGGAYVNNTAVTVTPGANITVTVGAGGTGVSAANGGNGGTSSFGSLVTANGGAGGKVGNSSTPNGAGGAVTTGTFNGGSGAAAASGNSGGGGGGAGSTGNGGNASGTTGGAAGAGGGGAGAAGRTNNGDGNDATALSGGGGGGRSSNSTNRSGGDGFRGQVRVTWTCPGYSLTSTNGVSPICNSAATSLITLTGDAADLPVGTYTVTYNRSLPSATGLTATMTVTTAGTGTFTATGLTTAGSSIITITNLSSGATGGVCSSTISANNTKEITVTSVPSVPGVITGPATVCQNGTFSYNIASVSGAESYTWSVPAGWSINSGQGTNAITVTAGNFGQDGSISVIASNFCGASANPSSPVLSEAINPVISTHNTGYTSSSTKTSGDINCNSGTLRGYAKFPLSDLNLEGITVTGVTLTVVNNGSITPSSAINDIRGLANNDPVSTGASALYSAIGSGTVYNSSTWSNTGTLNLAFNAAGISDVQNRISSPAYLAVGFLRNGSATYIFHGMNGGANAPKLQVNYTLPRFLSVSVEQNPSANAGPDASACITGYELNGVIGGSATGVVWTTAGDGTFDNAGLLNAEYTAGTNDLLNGSVTLTMTTTGSASCAAVSDNVVLNVFGAAPASPTVNTAPASVCPPVTGVALAVNAVANAESYSWVSNSGSAITFTGPTNSTTTTVDLAVTANSTYSVHVYAMNACGSSAYTGIGIRRSVSTPSAISGALIACDNSNENYSVNPVGGAETYTWSGPAGALINGQPTPQTIADPFATITFPSGYGTGTVSVTANVACFVSPARSLTVKSTPSAPVNLFGVNKICPGSTYTYNVPAVSGAVSYNWTVPAGVVISDPASPPYGSTTEITFPAGYNLTGTAGNICVTAVSQCATESAPRCRSIVSVVPVITTAITANPSATGLCNTTANFSVAANANADEFIWTLPSGVTFNTASNLNAVGVQIPAGFTGGTIQVTAKNATCPLTGNVRTLNISGTPQTPGAITAFPGAICYNSPAMFSINAVNGATSYQWNVTGTGNTISGQSNTPPFPFIDVNWGNGNGVVQVRAVNSCGTSAYRMLAVNPSCREIAESVAAPENISVFPNPSSGIFNLVFEGKPDELQVLQIADLSGRIIFTHQFSNLNDGINSFEVVLPATAKGLFIAELRSLSKSERIKLMVE